MKPLPMAPFTNEEFEAVAGCQDAPGISGMQIFALHSQAADRRDAEQMFERMKWQAEGLEQGYDWRTERRGWFPSDWGRASDEYLNPL